MISSTHSRKTSRRRATFCKRLTSKLNLSSICYSKLFLYIYIDSTINTGGTFYGRFATRALCAYG